MSSVRHPVVLRAALYQALPALESLPGQLCDIISLQLNRLSLNKAQATHL